LSRTDVTMTITDSFELNELWERCY